MSVFFPPPPQGWIEDAAAEENQGINKEFDEAHIHPDVFVLPAVSQISQQPMAVP